jgi:hypothetical protein
MSRLQYHVSEPEFVGLGKRAYQCEVTEVNPELQTVSPAFVGYGETPEMAKMRASLIATTMNPRVPVHDYTDSQLSSAIKSLANGKLLGLVKEALSRKIAVNLVINTSEDCEFNKEDIDSSAIHVVVFRHQIL